MEDLLGALNAHGFAFDRDFVLKTCLVLLGRRCPLRGFKVSQTWRPGADRGEWDEISDAVKEVLDWVRGKTFIQCDKALAVLPCAYSAYLRSLSLFVRLEERSRCRHLFASLSARWCVQRPTR